MSEPLRLNLGGGPVERPGFVNVDRKLGGEVYPLAYPDASAVEIYASHILEHFSFREVEAVLRDWVRVLAPGGVIRLAVPDFAWIAETYLADPHGEAPILGYVLGGHVDADDRHGCLFDAEGLADLMQALGLVDIRPWESDQDDCAALPVSLNLQGRKPGGAAPEAAEAPAPGGEAPGAAVAEPLTIPAGAVKAVITMPRLAFTDNLFCAHAALIPLGIGIERIGGVFWHQSMAALLEAHTDDGTRYVLTMDYDTVFQQSDVLELVRLLETRPEIDALAALQMRREEDSPIFAVGDFVGTGPRTVTYRREQLAGDTLPVRTAHFGLTLLRTAALRKLPRPWFHHRPGPDGRWGDGRMDADIAFWHDWHAAGLTLHTALRVPVGHLELMVKWPDRNLHSLHQQVGAYHQAGKPGNVWR